MTTQASGVTLESDPRTQRPMSYDTDWGALTEAPQQPQHQAPGSGLPLGLDLALLDDVCMSARTMSKVERETFIIRLLTEAACPFGMASPSCENAIPVATAAVDIEI